jgi:hypothetical protein
METLESLKAQLAAEQERVAELAKNVKTRGGRAGRGGGRASRGRRGSQHGNVRGRGGRYGGHRTVKDKNWRSKEPDSRPTPVPVKQKEAHVAVATEGQEALARQLALHTMQASRGRMEQKDMSKMLDERRGVFKDNADSSDSDVGATELPEVGQSHDRNFGHGMVEKQAERGGAGVRPAHFPPPEPSLLEGDWGDQEGGWGHGPWSPRHNEMVEEPFPTKPVESAILRSFMDKFSLDGATTQGWVLRDASNADAFVVLPEDLAVYASAQYFRMQVDPDELTVDQKGQYLPDEYSRLYCMMKVTLEEGVSNRVIDKPEGFNFDNQRLIVESRSPENWDNFFEVFMRTRVSIAALYSATTTLELTTGQEGPNGSMLLYHVMGKLLPLYSIAWRVAYTISYYESQYPTVKVEKSDDSGFAGAHVTSLWDMLASGAYGMDTAANAVLASLTRRGIGGNGDKLFLDTLDRLVKYEKYFARTPGQPQSMFSTQASTIMISYRQGNEVFNFNSGLDPRLTSYGQFASESAFYAYLLACNEINLIRMCASMVKTKILEKHGISGADHIDIMGQLLDICAPICGYDLIEAMRDPEKYSRVVKSRVSVSSIGSLAGVWLATHEEYTYEDLLMSGSEATKTLTRYARLVPFVQALLMFSLRGNDSGTPARITVDQVVTVFSEFAVTMVVNAPGFDREGTSRILDVVDQEVATTLFYGTLMVDPSRSVAYLDETLNSSLRRAGEVAPREAPFVWESPGDM